MEIKEEEKRTRKEKAKCKREKRKEGVNDKTKEEVKERLLVKEEKSPEAEVKERSERMTEEK